MHAHHHVPSVAAAGLGAPLPPPTRPDPPEPYRPDPTPGPDRPILPEPGPEPAPPPTEPFRPAPVQRSSTLVRSHTQGDHS
jgi:hypothetical protein